MAGLNDKLLLDNEARAKKTGVKRGGSGIEIDDVSFHQCVKLGKVRGFPPRAVAPAAVPNPDPALSFRPLRVCGQSTSSMLSW
jgi:hypothetical protein